jgi:hypothetical protein
VAAILAAEATMGRPIGSVNREKPFNDALRLALRGDPLRLPGLLRSWPKKLRKETSRPSGKSPTVWTGSQRRSSIGVTRHEGESDLFGKTRDVS